MKARCSFTLKTINDTVDSQNFTALIYTVQYFLSYSGSIEEGQVSENFDKNIRSDKTIKDSFEHFQ